MKYFSESIEYPRGIAFNPLPWNTVYVYVSSTFLDGFINYVQPIKAFLLEIYRDKGEVYNIDVYEPPFSLNWITYRYCPFKTAFDILTQPGRFAHTDLSIFRDDILILSKIEQVNSRGYDIKCEAKASYIYFWYDQDCSHCEIARFFTFDKEEEVIKEFEKLCLEIQINANPNGKILEIPQHFFRGWIKS